MKMTVLVALLAVFAVAQAQDVASPRTKHTKSQKPASYKVFPPTYHPSQICFNPNFYGFFGLEDISRMSPIPQPNIYYNLPVPLPFRCPIAWPGWNVYAYGYPSYNRPNVVPSTVGSTRGSSAPNETGSATSESSIKITRPTITVQITPPKFNENGTMTNAIKPPNVQSSEPSQMDDKTRKMIKHLLTLGSKQKPSTSDENKNRGDLDEEFVIGSRARRNAYPLPRVVYGNSNEPTTTYDRLKIFTQIVHTPKDDTRP